MLPWSDDLFCNFFYNFTIILGSFVKSYCGHIIAHWFYLLSLQCFIDDLIIILLLWPNHLPCHSSTIFTKISRSFFTMMFGSFVNIYLPLSYNESSIFMRSPVHLLFFHNFIMIHRIFVNSCPVHFHDFSIFIDIFCSNK